MSKRTLAAAVLAAFLTLGLASRPATAAAEASAAPAPASEALLAERARLRAALDRVNAEIDWLKRAGGGVRDDYRLRARLADAESLARKLIDIEARLGLHLDGAVPSPSRCRPRRPPRPTGRPIWTPRLTSSPTRRAGCASRPTRSAAAPASSKDDRSCASASPTSIAIRLRRWKVRSGASPAHRRRRRSGQSAGGVTVVPMPNRGGAADSPAAPAARVNALDTPRPAPPAAEMSVRRRL